MTNDSKLACKLRETAIGLLELAAALGGPPRVGAPPRPRASWLACDTCGAEYGDPSDRSGDPCLSAGCDGLLARKGDLARRPAGDPGPDLVRARGGRVLPVTTAQLAFEQALGDFAYHLPAGVPEHPFDGGGS